MRAAVISPFLVATFGAFQPAHAAAPARDALRETKDGREPYNVVQNRFFQKEGRWEIAPVVGTVPNDPMVKRFVAGVYGAHHFSENFAAEGAFLYSPDRQGADLKDLTNTLVQIAEQGSGEVNFQQPLEKMTLGATFAAKWAPVYGKINLIGERVVNFDFYGIAGLGMLSITEYYATYDGSVESGPPTRLDKVQAKVKVPVNLGVGLDFFLTSSVALKIDARSYLYADKKPQYDPDKPVDESRLYNNFVATAGVSVFFPKTETRIYNF